MSGLPRGAVLQFLFGCGAVGCIAGAIVVYLLVGYLLDATALGSAPICSTPSRSPTSACLSILGGQIKFEGSVGKNDERVTVALEDTEVDIRYQCNESPDGACSTSLLHAGATVDTGWWKGRMVAFGPEGARPTIVTEFNPVDEADHVSFFLVLVILGVSGMVAGLLFWQAPSSVGDFVRAVTASQPNPPRKVDLRRLWRITIGYSAWGGYIAWAFLFIFSYAVGGAATKPGVAAVLLVATGAASVGAALLLAPVGIYSTLRTAERRIVTVKRFQTLTGKGTTSTRFWYDRADGREGSSDLNDKWTNEVRVGDRLEALADPRTGVVERVLTAPPD